MKEKNKLFNELIKKTLSYEQKTRLIEDFISQNPNFDINENSTISKYHKANLVYLVIKYMPDYFQSLSFKDIKFGCLSLNGESLLIPSIENNRLDLAKIIVENNPEIVHQVDNQNNHPLSIALNNNFIKISDFLVENGADIKSIILEKHPIVYALKNLNIEAFRKILDYGFNINTLFLDEYEWDTEEPQYGILEFYDSKHFYHNRAKINDVEKLTGDIIKVCNNYGYNYNSLIRIDNVRKYLMDKGYNHHHYELMKQGGLSIDHLTKKEKAIQDILFLEDKVDTIYYEVHRNTKTDFSCYWDIDFLANYNNIDSATMLGFKTYQTKNYNGNSLNQEIIVINELIKMGFSFRDSYAIDYKKYNEEFHSENMEKMLFTKELDYLKKEHFINFLSSNAVKFSYVHENSDWLKKIDSLGTILNKTLSTIKDLENTTINFYKLLNEMEKYANGDEIIATLDMLMDRQIPISFENLKDHHESLIKYIEKKPDNRQKILYGIMSNSYDSKNNIIDENFINKYLDIIKCKSSDEKIKDFSNVIEYSSSLNFSEKNQFITEYLKLELAKLEKQKLSVELNDNITINLNNKKRL